MRFMLYAVVWALSLSLVGCSGSSGGTTVNSGKTSSLNQPIPLTSLAGQWQGVAWERRGQIHINLTLTELPDNQVQAKFDVTPPSDSGPPYSHTLTAKYDPGARAFHFEADRKTRDYLRIGSATATQMRMIYSASLNELAARVRSHNPRDEGEIIVFARPAEAKAKLLDVVEKAYGRAGMSFGGPDKKKLDEWASRLTVEYPKLDVQKTQMQEFPPIMRPLFEDAYFSKYFGKPFDQLTVGERAAIAKVTNDYYISEQFSSRGANEAARTLIWSRGTRVEQAWRNETQSLLTAPENGLYDVDPLIATATSLGGLWPSDRKRLAETINSATLTGAGPELMRRAEALAAKSNSPADINRWPSSCALTPRLQSEAAPNQSLKPSA